MEQFLTVLFGNFQHLFSLSICQVALFIDFNYRFKPYLAELLCTTFAHMHMSPILVVIRIPKQELPYNLGCNI